MARRHGGPVVLFSTYAGPLGVFTPMAKLYAKEEGGIPIHLLRLGTIVCVCQLSLLRAIVCMARCSASNSSLGPGLISAHAAQRC